MKQNKFDRRSFFKKTAQTALAASVFSIVPRHVLGGPGYTPPSEEITRAIIGLGGMGRGHMTFRGGRLVAVCDVDRAQLDKAFAGMKEASGDDPENVKAYSDFRELLARPDIDVIQNATPPHWHALVAVAAAQAGKDLLSEKPMTRTIAEGQKIVEAVNRNGRIFGLNTWFRYNADAPFYDSGLTTKTLKKLVDSGLLGTPLRVRIGASTGFDWKLAMWQGEPQIKPQPVPEGLDYDMWLGPAPYKPYDPAHVHEVFRGYWDYDGGGLGDMGQHYLDPFQYVLGKDDTNPVEIEADTPQQHPYAAKPWRQVWMRYADGTEIILDGVHLGDEIPIIEGPKGKVFRNMRSTIPNLQKLLNEYPDPAPMEADFWNSVRTRRKYPLNEIVGHRSCNLVNLSVIAVRLGRKLNFDPVAQRFINDEGANRLVNPPMRAPWYL